MNNPDLCVHMRMNINRRRNSVTIEMKSCLRRHRLSHQRPCHGVLLQPLSCNEGGGAFGCAGVRLLGVTSCCHLGELILNSDNGQRSFGEGAKAISGVPSWKQAWELRLGHQTCFRHRARGGRRLAGDRQTDKHLVRQWMCTAGPSALNSSLAIRKVCLWTGASL